MAHQSDKMQAALTRLGIHEEEEKKETDKELSDDDNSDN